VTRILCLHTADVHVATFGKRYAEMAPDVEVVQAVRADWLADARREGITEKLSSDVLKFLRVAAQSHDAVLCSCSTLGPIAEAAHADAANIIRIDTPLMQAAAAHDGTALVAFCLESTRAPTVALLASTYARLGVEPRFEVLLCADAWPFFERGDTDGFATAIAASVRRAAVDVPDLGCIVLAQASMAVAVPRLADMTVPVYASPRLAVTATLQAAGISAPRA
jgi:hypothetical protein